MATKPSKRAVALRKKIPSASPQPSSSIMSIRNESMKRIPRSEAKVVDRNFESRIITRRTHLSKLPQVNKEDGMNTRKTRFGMQSEQNVETFDDEMVRSTPKRQSTRKRRTKSALELLGKIKQEPVDDEGYYGGRWASGGLTEENEKSRPSAPAIKQETEDRPASPHRSKQASIIRERSHKIFDVKCKKLPDTSDSKSVVKQPMITTCSSNKKQFDFTKVEAYDEPEDCTILEAIPAKKKRRVIKHDFECENSMGKKQSQYSYTVMIQVDQGKHIDSTVDPTVLSVSENAMAMATLSPNITNKDDLSYLSSSLMNANEDLPDQGGSGHEMAKEVNLTSEEISTLESETMNKSKAVVPPEKNNTKISLKEQDNVHSREEEKVIKLSAGLRNKDDVGTPMLKIRDKVGSGIDGKAREASEALVKLANSSSTSSEKNEEEKTTIITQREILKDGKTFIQWVVTEGSTDGAQQGQIFNIGTINSTSDNVSDEDKKTYKMTEPVCQAYSEHDEVLISLASNISDSTIMVEADDETVTTIENLVVGASTVTNTETELQELTVESDKVHPHDNQVQKDASDQMEVDLDNGVNSFVMTSDDLANAERSRTGKRAKPQKQMVITPELQELLEDLEPDDDMTNHVSKLKQMSHRRVTMECKYCPQMLHDRHEFRKHIKSHKDVTFAPWKCPICDYRCDIRAGIVRHINIHSDIKPYACLECGREFTFKQKLHIHMKYHADVRDYQCHLCCFAFHELKALKYHLLRIHEIEYKDIKGKICVRKSKGAEVVNAHPVPVGLTPILEMHVAEPVDGSAPDMILVSEGTNIFTAQHDGEEVHIVPPRADEDFTHSKCNLGNEVEQQGEETHAEKPKDSAEEPSITDGGGSDNGDDIEKDTKNEKLSVTCKLTFDDKQGSDPKGAEHNKIPDIVINIEDVSVNEVPQPENEIDIQISDENVINDGHNLPLASQQVEIMADSEEVSQLGKHIKKTEMKITKGTLLSVKQSEQSSDVYQDPHHALKVITVPIISGGQKVGETGLMMMENQSEKGKVMARRMRNLRLHGPCKTNQTTARYKLGMQAHETVEELSTSKKPRRVNNQRVLGPDQVEDSLLQYCDVHNQSSGQKVTFHCQLCNDDLPSKTQFIAHLQRDHPDVKGWTCDICGYQCRLRSSLIVHMKLHSGEKNHHCEVCGKDFIFKQKLKLHMLHHVNLREYKCDKCDKAFNSKSELAKHIKRVHMTERPWECELCGSTFKEAARLRRHMEGHSGANKFLCQYCNRYYRSKTSLMQHMKSHTCMFHCDICNRSFGSYSGFMSHKVMHDESFEGYHCDMCDKVLHTKGSLKRHREIAHSDLRPFLCRICPKKFKTKKDLKNHGVVHSGERKFTCEICQFQCKRQESLRVHMRRHASVKPYQCCICKKEYTQKHALEGHMKHHKGVTITHHCIFCQQDFSGQNELELHMIDYHGNNEDVSPADDFEAGSGDGDVSNMTTEVDIDQQHGQGMTVYMCEECNSVFLTQDSLAVHILSEHMRHGFSGGIGVHVQDNSQVKVDGEVDPNKMETPPVVMEVTAESSEPGQNWIQQSLLDRTRSRTLGLTSRAIASEMEEAVETLVAISDPASHTKVVSVLHPPVEKNREEPNEMYSESQTIEESIVTMEAETMNNESHLDVESDDLVHRESIATEMEELDLESGETVVTVTDPNTNEEYLLTIQQDAIDSLLNSTVIVEGQEVNKQSDTGPNEQPTRGSDAKTTELPIEERNPEAPQKTQ